MQRSFAEKGAAQCGYCTPGLIMSAKALLDENPNPTAEEVRESLEGNLCRCTGYAKVVEAVPRSARGSTGVIDNEQSSSGEKVEENLTVVGTRQARYDADLKVAGTAVFGTDIHFANILLREATEEPSSTRQNRQARRLQGLRAIPE